MKREIFSLIFLTLLNATFSQNPGLPWSEDDYGIIREKVEYIIENSKTALNEFKKRHDFESYKSLKPTAQKVSILFSRMFCHTSWASKNCSGFATDNWGSTFHKSKL